MDLICRQCESRFRAAVTLPLQQAVRVICPACGKQMVLRPAAPSAAPPAPSRPLSGAKRRAVIADEPRAFRDFLGEELRGLGFEVAYFDTGDAALEFVRSSRAELVILNVYLKGK